MDDGIRRMPDEGWGMLIRSPEAPLIALLERPRAATPAGLGDLPPQTPIVWTRVRAGRTDYFAFTVGEYRARTLGLTDDPWHTIRAGSVPGCDHATASSLVSRGSLFVRCRRCGGSWVGPAGPTWDAGHTVAMP